MVHYHDHNNDPHISTENQTPTVSDVSQNDLPSSISIAASIVSQVQPKAMSNAQSKDSICEQELEYDDFISSLHQVSQDGGVTHDKSNSRISSEAETSQSELADTSAPAAMLDVSQFDMPISISTALSTLEDNLSDSGAHFMRNQSQASSDVSQNGMPNLLSNISFIISPISPETIQNDSTLPALDSSSSNIDNTNIEFGGNIAHDSNTLPILQLFNVTARDNNDAESTNSEILLVCRALQYDSTDNEKPDVEKANNHDSGRRILRVRRKPKRWQYYRRSHEKFLHEQMMKKLEEAEKRRRWMGKKTRRYSSIRH